MTSAMTSWPDRPSLKDYTIRIANPEQQLAHGKAGFVIWHNNTDWESYWGDNRRERNEAVWGKDGRLLTWVLVRRDDPEGEIYAGCEIYRRHGWLKPRGSDEIRDTYVYGIASVVTPKQHLRQGYASRLLSLLHHQLGCSPSLPESWGPPPAAAPNDLVPPATGSILWSDVGSTFYSRCTVGLNRAGWLVNDRQCSELVWRILPSSEPTDQADLNGTQAGWEWIYEADLPDITPRLSMEAKERLAVADSSEKSIFTQDPATEGVLSFVPVKGSWSRPPKTQPTPYGLRLKAPTGNAAEDGLVLFTLSQPSIGPRFHITCVSQLTAEQVPILLRALDSVANKEGWTEGWFWDVNPESDWVKAWQAQEGREVKVNKRAEVDGHLLGVAWYGEEEEGELLDGQMWSWC